MLLEAKLLLLLLLLLVRCVAVVTAAAAGQQFAYTCGLSLIFIYISWRMLAVSPCV